MGDTALPHKPLEPDVTWLRCVPCWKVADALRAKHKKKR